jgi:abortive infection bacteriophage resistance protein
LAKRKIANFYGVSDSVFESWLHSIVYVRNICAHHSRLWNKTLRIQPLFPRKTISAFLSSPVRPDRIYYVLCIIQYLLRTVNPSTSFPFRLKALLTEFPNVDITAMGFVKDWKKEKLWQ